MTRFAPPRFKDGCNHPHITNRNSRGKVGRPAGTTKKKRATRMSSTSSNISPFIAFLSWVFKREGAAQLILISWKNVSRHQFLCHRRRRISGTAEMKVPIAVPYSRLLCWRCNFSNWSHNGSGISSVGRSDRTHLRLLSMFYWAP